MFFMPGRRQPDSPRAYTAAVVRDREVVGAGQGDRVEAAAAIMMGL